MIVASSTEASDFMIRILPLQSRADKRSGAVAQHNAPNSPMRRKLLNTPGASRATAGAPISAVGLMLGIFGVGCGSPDPGVPDGPNQPDASTANCSAVGTIGSFYRRTVNPRIVAGHHTYTDGMIDVGISAPDLRWDEPSQRWNVYFHGPHAASFGAAATQMVRHATSPDLSAWTID